mgnify:CR=1 FL=1
MLSCVLLTLLFPLRLRILRTLRAPVHWFAVHAAILFLSRLLYDFSLGRARILVPCRLVAIPKLSSTIKHVKAMAKINKVVFSILESLCYLDENLSKLLVVDIANEKLVEVLFNVKPLRGRRVDKRKLAISIHWPISSRREVVLGSNKFSRVHSIYRRKDFNTINVFTLYCRRRPQKENFSYEQNAQYDVNSTSSDGLFVWQAETSPWRD